MTNFSVHKQRMVKIAVIGAGVNGLCSAYNLKLFDSQLDVTIFAEKFSPNTTSDGAAGIARINHIDEGLSNTPRELLLKWAKATYSWYREILKTDQGPLAGICEMSGYQLSDQEDIDISLWASITDNAFKLTKEQLERFGPEIRSGYLVSCITCESSKYLPWLMERFKQKNGKAVQKKINSFDELSSFDIIINCSGLGARDLCKDEAMVPLRGQVARVKAPWIKQFYHVDYTKAKEPRFVYIYPNTDTIIVGGTKYKSWNLKVSEEEHQKIMEGASQFMPSLKNAELVKDWVGLRPSRLSSVRVEKEDLLLNTGARSVPKHVKVVHNYGQGPCGITLHWGCAQNVLELVKTCLAELEASGTKSKL